MVSLKTKSNNPFCGTVDLLATILEVDKDELRVRYGLPSRKYPCPICGKLTGSQLGYCSKKCRRISHYTVATCPQCKLLFIILKPQLKARATRNMYGRVFCTHPCASKYNTSHKLAGFGLGYGIGRVGFRKWDEAKIIELRMLNGWGGQRIGRALGIPWQTVGLYLRRYKEERIE